MASMYAEEIVSLIEEMPQLDAILVFHNYSCQQEKWAESHPKVKDIFTGIHSLVKRLEVRIDPIL